jgi:hypothetical protein
VNLAVGQTVPFRLTERRLHAFDSVDGGRLDVVFAEAAF